MAEIECWSTQTQVCWALQAPTQRFRHRKTSTMRQPGAFFCAQNTQPYVSHYNWCWHVLWAVDMCLVFAFLYFISHCKIIMLTVCVHLSSKQRKGPLSLQDFRLIAVLGRGHFGKVHFLSRALFSLSMRLCNLESNRQVSINTKNKAAQCGNKCIDLMPREALDWRGHNYYFITRKLIHVRKCKKKEPFCDLHPIKFLYWLTF